MYTASPKNASFQYLRREDGGVGNKRGMTCGGTWHAAAAAASAAESEMESCNGRATVTVARVVVSATSLASISRITCSAGTMSFSTPTAWSAMGMSCDDASACSLCAAAMNSSRRCASECKYARAPA